MKLDDRVKARIGQLVMQAPALFMSSPEGPTQSMERERWLVSALNLIEVLSPVASQYRMRAIAATTHWIGIADNRVDLVYAILCALSDDLEHGLVGSISVRAQAEVFDDLLDQAAYYLRGKFKEPAGVLAGVIFEDSVRKATKKHQLTPASQDLEQHIIALEKAGLLNQVDGKKARVAAAVRTKATHAQWDEFDESAVVDTIKFGRELIQKLLE